MDKLKEIIDTFAEEEKKEFRAFINRQKKKKERKDLKLFELLDKTEKPKGSELEKELYSNGNKQAYHRLRKRLQHHLADFILLKQFQNDPTTASHTRGMLSLANYLFEKGSDKLAWQWLCKAEEQAAANEHFNLLNAVYNLQLEYCNSPYAEPLETIIERKKKNQQLAEEDERAKVAYSIIRKGINNAVKAGREIDFDQTITAVLKEYGLEEAVFQRPALLYKVLDITRQVMMAQKDFYEFEQYLIAEFGHFTRENVFSKSQHFYKLGLTYMLAHVLYRNRKFKKSLAQTERLKEEMQQHNKAYYWQFYPKYVLLKAANLNFLGQCKQAIELLEDKQLAAQRFGNKTRLNRLLNTAVYYFNQGEFSHASRLLHSLGHTDNWCEKQMGPEWVLKKNLIELVLQYELGNIDIVLNRMRAIDRSHKTLLSQPAYQKVRDFLQVFKLLIDNPAALQDRQKQEAIYSRLVVTPREREDLQAMAFYSWIKAKMLNENYYSVLLDTVNK